RGQRRVGHPAQAVLRGRAEETGRGYEQVRKFAARQLQAGIIPCVETIHAEKLMERILFLEGAPNMTDIGPIHVGTNVKLQFESDLALEMRAVRQLNAAIKVATEAGDNA